MPRCLLNCRCKRRRPRRHGREGRESAVAIDRAIYDRHCRAAAILGIIVDTAAGRIIIPLTVLLRIVSAALPAEPSL